MADEKGNADESGNDSREHADIWLDFAEGMGARRDMTGHTPIAEINGLMSYFHRTASEGSAAEALAAFYAYESQVPRVAQEKARGLREMYGADEKTCGYFTLHATADVFHANVWRHQLEKQLAANPEAAEKALTAGEAAAKSLWQALDGIEARRTAKVAA